MFNHHFVRSNSNGVFCGTFVRGPVTIRTSRQFPLKLQHFRNDDDYVRFVLSKFKTDTVQSLEFPLHLFTTLSFGRGRSDLSVCPLKARLDLHCSSVWLWLKFQSTASRWKSAPFHTTTTTSSYSSWRNAAAAIWWVDETHSDPMMRCCAIPGILLYSATPSIERRQPRTIDDDDDAAAERNGQRVIFLFLLLNTRTMTTTTSQVSFSERKERRAVRHYQLMDMMEVVTGCRCILFWHRLRDIIIISWAGFNL